MSLLHFPDDENPGTVIDYDYEKSLNISLKVDKLPNDYASVKKLNLSAPRDIFIPVATVNLIEINDHVLSNAMDEEKEWLSSYEVNNDGWSSYHARKQRNIVKMKDTSSIMPLIREKVHTLDTQYHCMKIIRDTIAEINCQQTPLDVCDQPVYALTKQIQWMFPDDFRNYFSLFAGMHVEKFLLVIVGQYTKGSGLEKILGKSNLSVIGLENIMVNASDIKRARYALQVSACAIFKKLQEAHANSGSDLLIWKWLDEKHENMMCLYWKNILELQLSVLVYVRSLREANFQLHLACLRSILKWSFSSDHQNYSRWLTVHLFDMLQLKSNFPDIYSQFSNGKFTFQKTLSELSKMALDHVHEQNNTIVKGTGGATHLVNVSDKSSLVRWELCAGELP